MCLYLIMNQKIALKQLSKLNKYGRDMRLAAKGWENDWQTLASIILSARTRDEVTIKVCTKMFEKFPSSSEFSKLKISKVKKLIGSINFFNNKSKMILNCAKVIEKNHNGIVPRDFEKLLLLPGVGRKTANVFLAEFGGANIGVDTHVSYISQYLKWANSDKPEIIEKQLGKLFPKSKWNKMNYIMVRFGKTYTSKKEKDFILDEIKKVY